MSKFAVITSQYYHSRFSFICEFNAETFRKQALEFIEELEKYKRQPEDERPFNYGDFDEKYYRDGRSRINVNDSGDIYFEITESLSAAVHEVKEYWEVSHRQAVGFKPKRVTENICAHHDGFVIKKIVSNHFTIL